jgi:hypothetical protein
VQERGVAGAAEDLHSTFPLLLHHPQSSIDFERIDLYRTQIKSSIHHHERQNSQLEALHGPEAWNVSIAPYINLTKLTVSNYLTAQA